MTAGACVMCESAAFMGTYLHLCVILILPGHYALYGFRAVRGWVNICENTVINASESDTDTRLIDTI